MLLELAVGDAYGAGFEYADRDFVRVEFADRDGAVIAVNSQYSEDWSDWQTTFHQVDASGEITGTTVVEEAHIGDRGRNSPVTVLGESVAITWEGEVAVVPFGETTRWEESVLLSAEDHGNASLTAVPGALVAVSGGITALVP